MKHEKTAGDNHEVQPHQDATHREILVFRDDTGDDIRTTR